MTLEQLHYIRIKFYINMKLNCRIDGYLLCKIISQKKKKLRIKPQSPTYYPLCSLNFLFFFLFCLPLDSLLFASFTFFNLVFGFCPCVFGTKSVGTYFLLFLLLFFFASLFPSFSLSFFFFSFSVVCVYILVYVCTFVV